MAKHNEFGKQAEVLSIEFLKKNEYKIIDTNWRFGHLEADIIAWNNNIIAFIEVKARKSKQYRFDEIISNKKQQNLINLAEKYLEEKNIDAEIRFDVVFASKVGNQISFELIKNAF